MTVLIKFASQLTTIIWRLLLTKVYCYDAIPSETEGHCVCELCNLPMLTKALYGVCY